MKKAKAGAIVLVAVLMFGFASWSTGPYYENKSIEDWFYDFSENDSAAFRSMGAEAVPFLVQRLEDAPSAKLIGLFGWFSEMPKEIYRQRKQMWQSRAVFLLGEIGTEARGAGLALKAAEKSSDWHLQGSATVALMKINQESPDALIEKLGDTSNSDAWYRTAIMVGQFGDRAESAIPELLVALNHTNDVIHAHALVTLGMIASQPDKCVPALVPFLSSHRVGTRQKTIGTLAAFGTNALSAKVEIQGLLNDSDSVVRARAEWLLERFSKQ